MRGWQRSRDHRHEDRVGSLENALRDEREAGRAVEEDPVVLTAQWGENPREASRRLLRPVQMEIHVPVGEVGGKKVQVLEVGAPYQSVHVATAPDQGIATTLDPRLHTKQVGRRSLRVEVPYERPRSVGRVRYARFTADVVFPTPPLMLYVANTRIRR